MKRTKGAITTNTQGTEVAELQERIQMLSAVASRAAVAGKLGYQYGGERDIYEVLGYKTDLRFDDYYTQYKRQDVAKAIIDRPVAATWRGELTLVESDDDEDTELEKQWRELNERLHIKSKFARLDRLVGLGKYGVLLLGLDDVQNKDQMRRPVTPGSGRRLLYVKPLTAESAKIHEYERSPTNERYGLPTVYKVTVTNPGDKTTDTLMVHYTRIIHVPGQLLESEVEGVPRLEAVFNRLKDLEKIVGGSAEMFWRGARPGYQGKLDENYQMGQDEVDELKKQVDEYEHNLRRILVNQGVSLESLAQQVADPSNHVDVQIQMISAMTGMPKRVFTGSERGEQASTQDRNNWLDMIQDRREEYAEPAMVRPFVDTCIEYGILAAPEDRYGVEWSNLWAQSEKEKAEVGKSRAEALKAYVSAPAAMDVIPEGTFYEFFLGLEQDQIELIQEQRDAAIAEEEREFAQGASEGEEE